MKTGGYIVIVLFATLTLASAEILNQGWWKHMVFYQIYPKSFKDSDGDGYGDLNGITSKLQHFKDIGVGGIWLSPIHKSPQVDNGYDISDFREVDPIFGKNEDLDKLIQEANKLGIKVILDLVPNHTSDKHEWFEKSVKGESPYDDYYVWDDGKSTSDGNRTVPNNWVSVFNGSGWTYNEERGQFFYHQFYPQQPDLNYKNQRVQEEMKSIIKFWLDKGLHGFRIDAVPHIIEGDISMDEPRNNDTSVGDMDFAAYIHNVTKDQPGTYEIIKSWRDFVDEYANKNNKDEILLMTEAYTSLENTIKYYNYGSHIPFNFKYITDANKDSKATKFQEVAEEWLKSMPATATANWVMGNHDRNRVPTRYPGRGDQMIMLEMMLPGVAVTYYGEEIGMVDYTEGNITDFRDGCRTPMQWDGSNKAGFTTGARTWLPVNPNYTTVNVEAQMKEPKSHLNLYRQLVDLRKSNILMNGGVQTTVLNNYVFAVKRNVSSEIVVLLINFNSTQNVVVNLSNLMDTTKARVLLSDSLSQMTLNATSDSNAFNVPAGASVILTTASSASTMGVSVVSILLIAIVSFFRS